MTYTTTHSLIYQQIYIIDKTAPKLVRTNLGYNAINVASHNINNHNLQ
ncbi:MAG: hypothetical protein WCF28_03430 [Methanobacterium sp.]